MYQYTVQAYRNAGTYLPPYSCLVSNVVTMLRMLRDFYFYFIALSYLPFLFSDLLVRSSEYPFRNIPRGRTTYISLPSNLVNRGTSPHGLSHRSSCRRAAYLASLPLMALRLMAILLPTAVHSAFYVCSLGTYR